MITKSIKMMKQMNKNKQIAELIHRRREQMLVHSYIYYQLNDNIIDDSTWSKWAMELQQLQKDYPEISKQVVLVVLIFALIVVREC